MDAAAFGNLAGDLHALRVPQIIRRGKQRLHGGVPCGRAVVGRVA